MDERRKDIRKRFTKNKERLYKYDQNFYTKNKKNHTYRVSCFTGGSDEWRIFAFGLQNIPVWSIKTDFAK